MADKNVSEVVKTSPVTEISDTAIPTQEASDDIGPLLGAPPAQAKAVVVPVKTSSSSANFANSAS